MQFFLEVLIGGLLSGVMYALVALGYVLIYKASGVFNFAQGAMVFFAALTTAGLVDSGMSLWLALPLTMVAMVVLGLLTEKIVLRPLVAQHEITLFMATIGLTFFVEGLAQAIWGANVRSLDLGIEDVPLEWLLENANMAISQFDLIASGIAAVLVTLLAIFFSKTKIGRALRAVADDHQAALSIGIPLQHIWGIVWAVAGFVALVAGLLWGARNGVQFALTFVALKALPVLILGGFTSVPGAIVGGLIIGASEKLAEVYIGPHVGGGIEGWFPYVLALLFLLVRPGRALRREESFVASDARKRTSMLYREAGQFKATYAEDSQIFPIRQDRIGIALILAAAFVGIPLLSVAGMLADYTFTAILTPFLIFSLAALGLNILTGYAGQLSLGTAAFMAVGAFASYNFMLRIDGMPILGGLRPRRSLCRGGRHRLRPAQRAHPRLLSGGGDAGDAVLRRLVPDQGGLVHQLQFLGRDHRAEDRHVRLHLRHAFSKYLFVLSVVTVMALLAKNMVRTNIGRSWMAIRDMDMAAEVIGFRPMQTKLMAFAVSSFYCGVAGALFAYAYLGTVEPEGSTSTSRSASCS
jgi:branched-chain amino acid transport system permease protein